MSLLNPFQDPHVSEESKLVHKTLERTAKAVKKKYGLHPFGEGVSMPGGIIKFLTLCFESRDQLSRDELRELLIKSAQEMIAQAKANELEQFLESPPFEMKNVEIVIYNHDRNGRRLYDPEISTAEVFGDVLIYRTTDSQENLFKKEYEETYEEALAILQSKGRA